MTAFDIGDVVVLTAEFKVEGVPTDPTAVTLEIQPPTGTKATLTPAKTGAGAYRVEYSPTEPGVHAYRWSGTGAAASAQEGTFKVERRRVPA